MFFGTSERFPVQGHGNPRGRRGCGQTPNDAVGPRAQAPFELVSVHVPKERVERGGAGWGMGEAARLRKPRAIIASPCGNAL